MAKVIVSGTGCCLVDLMYNNIDFAGEAIKPFLSKKPGDGGLSPGKLVFREEFETFSGVRPEHFISVMTGGRNYDKINVGGPSIVSLIHAAQMAGKEKCEVRFYGRAGSDVNGAYLINSIKKTPVIIKDYALTGRPTPSTLVLSDPEYNNGSGERMFINSIGAAWDYYSEDLKDDFFSSDIVVFGGTALVPHIHDKLASLLKKAKSKRCITIVNTVFDFRNEKANPSEKWPVGEGDESYSLTDLLITDREEALRLSGQADTDKALKFFQDKGVRSAVITKWFRSDTCFLRWIILQAIGNHRHAGIFFNKERSQKISHRRYHRLR